MACASCASSVRPAKCSSGCGAPIRAWSCASARSSTVAGAPPAGPASAAALGRLHRRRAVLRAGQPASRAEVLEAACEAYVGSVDLPLVERLMAALAAGDAEGGDRHGESSATVYVVDQSNTRCGISASTIIVTPSPSCVGCTRCSPARWCRKSSPCRPAPIRPGRPARRPSEPGFAGSVAASARRRNTLHRRRGSSVRRRRRLPARGRCAEPCRPVVVTRNPSGSSLMAIRRSSGCSPFSFLRCCGSVR